jgi:hypothetical protein
MKVELWKHAALILPAGRLERYRPYYYTMVNRVPSLFQFGDQKTD